MSSSARRSRPMSPEDVSAGMRGVFLVLAALGVGGLLIFFAVYPPGKLVAFGIVALFMVSLLWHRLAWLLVLPLLVPVVDRTLWTGDFNWPESDALFSTVLLVAGLRGVFSSGRASDIEPGGSCWRMSPVSGLVLLLAISSYVISTDWSGLSRYTSLVEASVGYVSSINGIRLAKGALWALCLAPLLADAFRRQPEKAAKMLVWGITGGAVLVSAVALIERYLFVSVLDFASDYRTTALFWEMNVGGATLDGWLALSVPFVFWLVVQPTTERMQAVALVALSLIAYGCFTTFSRGLYAGLALGLLLTVTLWFVRHRPKEVEGLKPRNLLAWGILALLLCAALVLVFRSGGYRGLGATLGLAVAVFMVAPRVADESGRVWAGGLVIALGASVASVLAMFIVPKGIYIAYAVNAVAIALLFQPFEGQRSRQMWSVLRVAGVFWLAVNTALVTIWWAPEGTGAAATRAGLLASALVLVPFIRVAGRPDRVWQANKQSLPIVFITLGVMAIAAIMGGTQYAKGRFETVDQDMESRRNHWSESAAFARGANLTGVGVGQFATQSLRNSERSDYPGVHQLGRDADGKRYVHLIGPGHVLGFGELYRVSQRITSGARPPVLLTADVRLSPQQGIFIETFPKEEKGKTGTRRAALGFEICSKHLLYADICLGKSFWVASTRWRTITVVLDEGKLNADTLAPTVFSFFVASPLQSIDVTNLKLVDSAGRRLLDNGDFGQGGGFWFFSSDRFHLPWHAKNLWLHIWVEQGWYGLFAISLLGLAAFWRVTVGNASRHPLALPLAGALLGFACVGAFDSLIDAPRLTAYAFMLMVLALGLRGKKA